MKYKYIPDAADGVAGIKFRQFLDMKNAREARRKARLMHERANAGQDTRKDDGEHCPGQGQ
eukprot:5244217-Pyramimonas_sp.AAC.2